MDTWEDKRLAALVDAAEIAVTRARYVFMVINVAGVLMLVAQFNGLLPFIRHSVYKVLEQDLAKGSATAATNEAAVAPTADTKRQADDKAMMKQPRDLRVEIYERELSILSIPVIGIRLHTSDLSVLGSIAMGVLSLWFFFSLRRENHVVEEIVSTALQGNNQGHWEDENALQRADYLYQAVAHYFVFTNISERDAPYGVEPRTGARWTVKALFFVPFWIPLAVVICDLLSIVLPLKWLRLAPISENVWAGMDTYQCVECLLREAVAMLIIIHNLLRCLDCARFDDGTRNRLVILKDRLKNPVID